MINDREFLEHLDKVLQTKPSCEVEDAFLQKYIEPIPKTTDDLLKIKYAAEHGYLDAYESLGRAYLAGTGCEADPEQGIDWVKKSFEMKKYGSYLLGDAYRYGLGVKKDFEQAYYWYDLATQTGDCGVNRKDDFDPEELLLRGSDWIQVKC